MCGIAGIYKQLPESELEIQTSQMLDLMRHRGPDQQGIKTFSECAIGANRLSIIDIVKGNQPIHNEDLSIWIVYNGEVYNFKELKADLIKHGHIFYTNTDTEVVIHVYEQYGIEGFEKLNGMFAFAIYDQRTKMLILVRDRIGIKPLYYSLSNGLAFASEMKALLALKDNDYHLDVNGIAQYCIYDYTPAPNTVVKNIFKLMPGNCLIKDDNGIHEKTFVKSPLHTHNAIKKENMFISELDEVLYNSVNAQLVADVPVGIFLSGGIDSSTIAYFASKSNKDIKTFSITFEEPSFDESKYAMLVSNRLGLKHYSEVFTFDVFTNLFERLTDFMDEPIADPSLLPTYFLSKLAKEHVKVVLSGEGGDEMFAGYPTYIAHRFATTYAKLPEFLKTKFIKPIINAFPVSLKNFSFDFITKRFVDGAGLPTVKRHIKWMGGFSEDELPLLIKDEFFTQITNDLYKKADEISKQTYNLSAPEIANILDILMYLPDDLLVKVDRSTMFASIESRVPFLDNRIVEFSSLLPFDYKIKGITQKYILKRLMLGRLPDVIIQRKKKGFGIPITKWLANDFRHIAESIIAREVIEATGLFNYHYIQRLFKEHVLRHYDHRKKIWPILVLIKWLQKYKIPLL